jgi:hypothetical protein
VRDPEQPGAAGGALLLEPAQVLAPADEVVHLLDLNPPEEVELLRELVPPLLNGGRPDLRRHHRLFAPSLERRGQRALGAPVHRRGVEDPRTRAPGRLHDIARELVVTAEGVPRAEPDDGPEAPLLHREARRRRGPRRPGRA